MEQILIQKNSRIDKPTSWFKDKSVRDLSQRLQDCPNMDYVSLVCTSCDRVIKMGCAKLSCLSPYCMDEECIKNRLRLSMMYFNSLHIRSKKLLHIVFGFPKVSEFNREIREQHNKFFRMLKKQMLRLGTPLKMIIVRDLNGTSKNLYVHYHTASLPVKSWRKYRQNLYFCRDIIMKKLKIEFSIKFLHYRKTWSLFKYFSFRVVGLFQNSDKEKFGYKSLMGLTEYYKCFYKSRKVKLIGLKPCRQASVLALMLDNLTKICPYCGSKHLILKPNYLIQEAKPPPDYEFKISEENLKKIAEITGKC